MGLPRDLYFPEEAIPPPGEGVEQGVGGGDGEDADDEDNDGEGEGGGGGGRTGDDAAATGSYYVTE